MYKIVYRHLVAGQGWKCEEIGCPNLSYEDAAKGASKVAHWLDEKYGDDHFWTVDLISTESGGAMFQLFHGRLS